MPDVEITIDNPGNPASEHLRVRRSGEVGEALRACILSLSETYADDPHVQRIAEAIYAVKSRPTA